MPKRLPPRVADVGHPDPWLRFKALLDEQGRVARWVARQAGMDASTLYGMFHYYPGCPATPERKTHIARLLGVPQEAIWGVGQLEFPAGEEPQTDVVGEG